jgi:hypothetical protein
VDVYVALPLTVGILGIILIACVSLTARNPARDRRLALAESQRAKLAATLGVLYDRALAGRDADPELEFAASEIERMAGNAAPGKLLAALQQRRKGYGEI